MPTAIQARELLDMHPTPHRSQVTRKDTTAEKKNGLF